MPDRTSRWALLAVAVCLAAGTLWAQMPPRGLRPPVQPGPRPSVQPPTAAKEPPAATLPFASDKRLLALHREFVLKAEKLAAEYETAKQHEKARLVCEQILKLVPNYPKAAQMLQRINEEEANAERKVIEVAADRPWQDTGIRTVPGKPIQIKATGTWTFKMSHKLGPDGMEVPPEMKDFKLGSLIGVIATDDPKQRKPFLIGAQKTFVADRAGRLLLQMHDSDPSDNQGKLSVEIRGTFQTQ
ncbi:MAG: hypothetical protein ACYC35_20170 [Pirellulales bacterium]|jgi:hypothetical protein